MTLDELSCMLDCLQPEILGVTVRIDKANLPEGREAAEAAIEKAITRTAKPFHLSDCLGRMVEHDNRYVVMLARGYIPHQQGGADPCHLSTFLSRAVYPTLSTRFHLVLNEDVSELGLPEPATGHLVSVFDNEVIAYVQHPNKQVDACACAFAYPDQKLFQTRFGNCTSTLSDSVLLGTLDVDHTVFMQVRAAIPKSDWDTVWRTIVRLCADADPTGRGAIVGTADEPDVVVPVWGRKKFIFNGC